MAVEIGTVVLTPKNGIGIVRHRDQQLLSVQMIPAYFNHEGLDGWVQYHNAELTEINICACAKMGYWLEGHVQHTGCDLKRRPGRGRTFLPGHDAKLKSFLIKAWGHPMLGEYEHSIDAARQFGFSIQVAAGIDRAQNGPTPKTRGADGSTSVKNEASPAMRDAMRRACANEMFRGKLVGIPTGTVVALQRRGLASWGHVSRKGRELIEAAELPETLVLCEAEDGKFADHSGHYHCRRCGKVDPAFE